MKFILSAILLSCALLPAVTASTVTVSAIAAGIADSAGNSLPNGTPFSIGYFTSDGTPGGTVLTNAQIAAFSSGAEFENAFVRYGSGEVGGENVLHSPGFISGTYSAVSDPDFLGRRVYVYFNTGTEAGVFTNNGGGMLFPTDDFPNDQVNFDFSEASMSTEDIVFGTQGIGTSSFSTFGEMPNFNLSPLPSGPADDILPITRIGINANGITLTKPFASGQTEIAQYSPDLSPGSWIDIGTFTNDGENAVFTDTDSERRNRPVGYYRARVSGN